jgi:hypothetical protein
MNASCGCREGCRSLILSTVRKASSNCVLDMDVVESTDPSPSTAAFVACSAIDFRVCTYNKSRIYLIYPTYHHIG